MRIFAAILIGTLSVATAPLAQRHWTGTTNGTWSVAANWGGTAPVANDDLIFDNATNANILNNDFPAGTGFNSLTWNAAATFSPGGNSVAVGAGGITQAAGSTFNNFIPLTLAASQTWTTASSGGFFMNGPLTTLGLGANTLTLAGDGTVSLSNITSGTGPINLTGTVTLTLTSQLNSTGTLTVGSGTLLNLATPNTVEPPIVVNSGGHITVANGSSTLMTRALALNAGSSFDVVINGTAVTQFSRITSNNNITIAGNLAVTNNIAAPLGTPYGILTAQLGGTLSGTFAGLPNNATFTAGGQTFQINYSSTSVVLTVVSGTTTNLTSSLNPSFAGDPVTFTATVSPTATGSVTFFDGVNNLGTVSLNGSSQASLTTPSLSVGPHNMSALYNGNGTLGSSTGTLTQQVNGPVGVPTMNEWLLMALGGLLTAIAAIALRRRAAV